MNRAALPADGRLGACNAVSSVAGDNTQRAKRAIFKSPDCFSVRWAACAKASPFGARIASMSRTPDSPNSVRLLLEHTQSLTVRCRQRERYRTFAELNGRDVGVPTRSMLSGPFRRNDAEPRGRCHQPRAELFGDALFRHRWGAVTRSSCASSSAMPISWVTRAMGAMSRVDSIFHMTSIAF